MEGLGRVIDALQGIVPVDLGAGANVGKVLNMAHVGAVTVVLFKAAGAATDPVVTFRQSKTAAGGSIKDMTGLSARTYYKKEGATVPGTWTAVAQAAGATVTLTGSATLVGIYAFEIANEDMDVANGFLYFQANIQQLTTTSLGCVLYIPHELKYPRGAASLPNLIT